MLKGHSQEILHISLHCSYAGLLSHYVAITNKQTSYAVISFMANKTDTVMLTLCENMKM